MVSATNGDVEATLLAFERGEYAEWHDDFRAFLCQPIDVERLARALASMAMQEGANECTTTVDCGDYMGGVPTIAEFAERIAREYAVR